MTQLTMGRRAGGFILSEANGYRSREEIQIAASQTLQAGQVMGRITTGALSAVATAFAGNTGNGAMGAVTVDAGAQTGTYRLVITEPGSNVGNFVVERPDGVIDGQGDVAAAYNGSINFTLADGGTDFAPGDGFDIVVSAAAATEQGKYVKHDPEGTNGSQTVAGVLFDGVTTGVGETAKAVLIARDAEVVLDDLVWDDHDAGEKTAAVAALAALGILARD